jgi:Fur family ferric uptake transcriptional regulator
MEIKRRNTPTKEAVLNILTKTGKAMSQDAIEKKMKIAIDRATIYRVLNQFCEDGIVHKIIAEDGKQYFAICMKCEEKKSVDHHFHFRCLKCQTIECLQETVHFTIPKGYQVKGVNCLLTGLCKNCS